MRAYAEAWRMVRDDARDREPIGTVVVDPAVQREHAQAIADTRDHRVRVSPGEAAQFEARLVGGARQGQRELARHVFTALHEGSHVTGPAQPAVDTDDKLHTMWEEGLASLQARRLLPRMMQESYGVPDVMRPPVSDITYGGIAQRIVELFELGDMELDTPIFDDVVRTLAEEVPWRDRAGWIAARMAREHSGSVAATSDLDELTSMVRGQVMRTEPGTGRIGSILRDLAAR